MVRGMNHLPGKSMLVCKGGIASASCAQVPPLQLLPLKLLAPAFVFRDSAIPPAESKRIKRPSAGEMKETEISPAPVCKV